MNARDVMSSPVLSVGPGTPLLEVAALLQERRIGGVPVVAGNELLGIVTERDLLHRHELGTVRTRDLAWWRRLVIPHLEPDLYVKSHGRCALHVMTRPVVVVAPETSLQEITLLFEKHAIGRVPVVDKGGALVGMVAAADLVRAFRRGSWISPSCATDFEDGAIKAALMEELRRQNWWDASISAVDVRAGVVRFIGFFDGESQRRASRVAAENIAGVQGVVDERRPVAELPALF